MGCGAAKAVQTEDITGSSHKGKVVTFDVNQTVIKNGTNGTAVRKLSKAEARPNTPGSVRKLSIPKNLPPARTGVLARAREALTCSSISLPKPVAFDIKFDDNSNSSNSISNGTKTNSRKQPPRRLMSLTEHSSQHLTAQELKQKQMRAEEKRLEKLEEIKSRAHKNNEKYSNNNNHKSVNNMNDIKNLENENDIQNNIITANNKENKSI